MGAVEDIALDLIGGVMGGKPSPRLVELRGYLPTNYIEDAAQFILEHPDRALIITGFFIPVPYVNPLPDGGTVETDGPPGAYFLGRALQQLNYKVTFVSDRWCTFLFKDLPGVDDYVEFPIADFKESDEYGRRLLSEKKPSIIIVTERCGVTRNRRYLNGRGWDISEFTAKLDCLLDHHPYSVGVGDGGNEMGMGNFAPYIQEIPHSLAEPAVSCSTRPVLARCSDWGCYGIITALSKICRRDLLPTSQEVQDFLVQIVDRGAVTGTGRKKYEVDGRSLKEQGEVINRYRNLLRKEGVEGLKDT